jgi:hypothetical protein
MAVAVNERSFTMKLRFNIVVGLACAAIGLSAAGGAVASPTAPTRARPTNPPAEVVLLDESGTQTATSLQAEDRAAVALTDSASPGTRITVAGFGSENRPGQVAVAPYCGFISTATAAGRAGLATCASRAHVRTAAQGNDTDLAAALAWALERLEHQPGERRIFIESDGQLDVHDSPQYGTQVAQRTPEAWRLIEQRLLPEARRAQVSIWPLGFGPQASYRQLQRFAVGGASGSRRCPSIQGTRPHAVIVRDDDQLVYALARAGTLAGCGQIGPPQRAEVDPRHRATLKVSIPAITTEGTLTVATENPLAKVTFADPEGLQVPASGTVDGQTFSLTGEGTDVTVLNVVNPLSGTWSVRVAAPDRSDARAIAFASWTGRLSASLFVTPVSPRPGETLHLQVQVLSRSGVLLGRALRGVHASAIVTGNFGTIRSWLHVAGGGLEGTATVPAGASGNVLVRTRVDGVGVTGATSSQTLPVQTSSGFLGGRMQLHLPGRVQPGETLHGDLTTINQGSPATGRLRLAGYTGLLATLHAGVVQIPSGTATTPFAITIGRRARTGPAYVTVVATHGRDAEPFAGRRFELTLAAKPSWIAANELWVLPLAVALIIAATWTLLHRRGAKAAARRRSDVAGLVVHLTGETAEDQLLADAGESFALTVLDSDPPQLDYGHHAGGGTPVTVRRAGLGVSVAVGDEPPVEVALGEPVAVRPGVGVRLDADREAGSPRRPAFAPEPSPMQDGINNDNNTSSTPTAWGWH